MLTSSVAGIIPGFALQASMDSGTTWNDAATGTPATLASTKNIATEDIAISFWFAQTSTARALGTITLGVSATELAKTGDSTKKTDAPTISAVTAGSSLPAGLTVTPGTASAECAYAGKVAASSSSKIGLADFTITWAKKDSLPVPAIGTPDSCESTAAFTITY